MRKIFIAPLFFILAGCFSEEKKDTGAKTNTAETAAPPYTATYSSKFEMGDAKHAEAVLKLWKAFDDGNFKDTKRFFADTMRFYGRDGSVMEGPIDSVNAQVQAWREMYSSVKSTVHAVMPVKSTDKNEHWVTIWGTEVSTDKQGKTDSVALQETWRFNKEGKINLMYQFGRALVPPAAPK